MPFKNLHYEVVRTSVNLRLAVSRGIFCPPIWKLAISSKARKEYAEYRRFVCKSNFNMRTVCRTIMAAEAAIVGAISEIRKISFDQAISDYREMPLNIVLQFLASVPDATDAEHAIEEALKMLKEAEKVDGGFFSELREIAKNNPTFFDRHIFKGSAALLQIEKI